jgi:hypothetical protein
MMVYFIGGSVTHESQIDANRAKNVSSATPTTYNNLNNIAVGDTVLCEGDRALVSECSGAAGGQWHCQWREEVGRNNRKIV